MATAPPSSRTTCSRCSTRSSSTGYHRRSRTTSGAAARARRARALARAPAVDAQRDTSILEREAAGAARLAVLVDGLRETPLIGRTLLRRVPAFTRMLLRVPTPTPQPGPRPRLRVMAPLREPARGRAAELAGAPLEPSQPTSGRSEAPRAGARRKSGGPGHDGARAVATLSRPACSRADDRRRSKPLAPIPLASPRQGTRRLAVVRKRKRSLASATWLFANAAGRLVERARMDDA